MVTKRREGTGRFGPIWRVLINGKPSPFTVTKSVPPRYGAVQTWDVINGPNDDIDLLFDAKSLEGALWAIEQIARAATKEG